MVFLDRLMPAWRHSDPEVRAAAVRKLGDDARHILESIARNDNDVRVRRAAIKRLDDPELLLEVGRKDTDDDLRSLATGRAEELLVDRAISHRPVQECLQALGSLSRPSLRVTVATSGSHPEVRRAALSALGDERSIAEVARRSSDLELSYVALERITDAAMLHRIAAGETPAEVALAAVARLTDPDLLVALSGDHQVHTSVRKRARAILDEVMGDDHPIRAAARHARQLQLCDIVERLSDAGDVVAATAALRAAEKEWLELAARGAADAGTSERFQSACSAVRGMISRAEIHDAEEQRHAAARHQSREARQQLCNQVEVLQGEEIPTGQAAARTAWQALGPIDDAEELTLNGRFMLALERGEQRYQRWQRRNAFRTQLEAIVLEAEALLQQGDPRAAALTRATLEKRWAKLAMSPAGTKWLADERVWQRRFVEAGEGLSKREETNRVEQQRHERDVRVQLNALCHHLEQLAQSDAFNGSTADRALTAAAEAEQHLRALPKEERPTLRQRLLAARQALAQRIDQQATAEDWKRWANADVQQQLIRRAQELLEANDPRQMLREIGRLEQEWKRFAVAPRQQSQVLWNRFRSARDELRRRCKAYLADNLARKEALCVAVEKLADSTDWAATAIAIRQMQEEWKEIGPVPHKQSDALFERFRAPANRFFTRHKEMRLAHKQQRDEALGRMRALAEAAESLATSSDWTATAAEMKRLQQEAERTWVRRRTQPPLRNGAPPASELLRQRFQAACDQFFDRYRRRGDLELEATLGAAEAVLGHLEALARSLGETTPASADDATQRLKEGLAAWSQITSLPAARARTLSHRLQVACDAIEAACPHGLPEESLEAEANVAQREKLCTRFERLVAALGTKVEEPTSNDLALRLKLALAAKTIGGQAMTPRQQALHEAREAAARLREKWQRLGPLIGPRARDLAARFEKAASDLQSLSSA